MKCFCAYRCLSAKPDSQAADALSLIFAVIKLRRGRKLTTVLIIKLTWEAYNTVTCEHKPCYIRRVPPFLSTFAITNGSKPYRVCLIGCKGESETTGSPMGAWEKQLRLINHEAHLWFTKDGAKPPNGADPYNGGTLRSSQLQKLPTIVGLTSLRQTMPPETTPINLLDICTLCGYFQNEH